MGKKREESSPATEQPSSPAPASAANSALAAELAETRTQLARVTRERDDARKREEAALEQLVAAEALLDEAAEGRLDMLALRRVQLLAMLLATLLRNISQAEARKLAAERQTAEAQRAADLARAEMREMFKERRTLKQPLRRLVQRVNSLRNTKEKLKEEVRNLRDEAASFGITRHIDCGCRLFVKKGQKCRKGALITVISPCRSQIPEFEGTLEL